MYRRSLLLIAFVSTALGPMRANPADGNPRLEKLFPSFIAPCCWRENLLVHHTPKADELRAEIKQLIAEGRSDDQIKTELIKQHSIRILSMPEGSRGQWLSWTPLVAVTAGLGVVIFTIRRLRRPASPTPTGDLPAMPDSEWDWDVPSIAGENRGRRHV